MSKCIMFSSLFSNDEIKDEISKIIPKRRKSIAIIPSEMSYSSEISFFDERYFEQLGFTKIDVFSAGNFYNMGTFSHVFTYDAIFLCGGNTFVFQHWLRLWGLLEKLKEYNDKGGILIGESAGSILLTENIDIARFADRDTIKSQDLRGIGAIKNFIVKPHFGSWELEYDRFQKYATMHNHPVNTIYDGECIIWNNNKIVKRLYDIESMISVLCGIPRKNAREKMKQLNVNSSQILSIYKQYYPFIHKVNPAKI